MQFGKGEDYNSYPRTLNNDVQLIDGLGLECMYRVFVPEVSDMYPDGFNSVVKVGGVTESLEGKCRPTHFDGVTTVVLKLFNIARADAAYFGQKDYQQVCVVRKMTADLNLPIEIVTCPIVRDQSGLALSSRNAYLTDQQKKQATSIHQSLLLAENIIVNEKCRNVETITNAIKNKILNADNAEIDYIAVADPITLNELKSIENHKKIIILIAAKISNTRLIDNKIISIQ
jgi:pantoate--beta-alanine ligase